MRCVTSQHAGHRPAMVPSCGLDSLPFGPPSSSDCPCSPLGQPRLSSKFSPCPIFPCMPVPVGFRSGSLGCLPNHSLDTPSYTPCASSPDSCNAPGTTRRSLRGMCLVCLVVLPLWVGFLPCFLASLLPSLLLCFLPCFFACFFA